MMSPLDRRRALPKRLSFFCPLAAAALMGVTVCVRTAAFSDDVLFHVSSTVTPAMDAEIRQFFHAALHFLNNELGLELSQPVSVFVYGSQHEGLDGLMNDFGYSEPTALMIARRAPFIAFNQRIYINAGDSLFRESSQRISRARVITHELAHIFHNDLMAGTFTAPVWIREGFAVRFELMGVERMGFHPTTDTAQEYLNLTRSGLRQGQPLAFRDIETNAQWDRRIQMFSGARVYGQAFVAVDYLFRTKGQPSILGYFRAFRASKYPDQNFVRSFGMTVEDFQREFEAYLMSLAR